MLDKYRKVVDDTITIRNHSLKLLKKHEGQLSEFKLELMDHKKVREIFQQAAVSTQTYLEKHLSLIVTNALKSVFYELNIEFLVKFDKKRNSTECKLAIIEDGEEYDIMDDRGFGVADIASFALRVAYVLMDSVDKVLILDEPFRNLDKDKIPHASKMVQELSHKLNIQFIIVTHIEELSECADKVLHVVKHKKLSIIESV